MQKTGIFAVALLLLMQHPAQATVPDEEAQRHALQSISDIVLDETRIAMSAI